MLSINMTTQPMKVEFNSQRASLNTTTKAAELIIDTEAATWDIQQPSGELDIDSTPCRYAYGIKNMPDLVRDYAQEGINSAVAGVGRVAEEGNRLARIESGENAVVNMAAESTVPASGDLALTYIPLPDIRYTPHRPQCKVNYDKLSITAEPGSVQSDYKPSQLDIQVTQYPSVNIAWTSGQQVDRMA